MARVGLQDSVVRLDGVGLKRRVSIITNSIIQFLEIW